MLAVIEEQQSGAGLQIGAERLPKRLLRLLMQAQHGRDGLHHEIRIGYRSEVHEPDPVRRMVDPIRGGLERQPRLAGASGAHQRQRGGLVQHLPDLGDLAIAADKGGGRKSADCARRS